jgi:hypothetical protein
MLGMLLHVETVRADDLSSRARELNQLYRSKATELLSTYLAPHRFYVDADVVPRVSGVIDLPYVPKNNAGFGGNPRLLDDVQALISSVRLTVKLPPDLSTQMQKQLSDILVRELPLDRWRGDSLTIRTFHINHAPTADEPSIVGNSSSPPSAGRTGSDKIASSMSSPKSAEAANGFQIFDNLNGWYLTGMIVVLIVSLFGLIAAAIIARGLFAVGGGLRTISNAARGPNTSSTGAIGGNRSRRNSKPARHSTTANRSPSPAHITFVHTAASIDRQLKQTHSKLLSIINTDPAAVGCAVELANRYLGRAGDHQKAVALLDLLPDMIGEQIYNRLGATQQRALLLAAQDYQIAANQSQLALGIANELLALTRSRLLSQAESAYSPRIREMLSRIDDRDLSRLLPAINADVLPRFISYLTPQRLAAVLGAVQTADTSFANRISWALLALPNVEEKRGLDQPIMNLLDAMQEMIRRRESNRYFPHLQAVIDHLPPSMQAAIAENLMLLNEDFARFVRGPDAASHDPGPSPRAEGADSDREVGSDRNAA